jgi:hypothetical protein
VVVVAAQILWKAVIMEVLEADLVETGQHLAQVMLGHILLQKVTTEALAVMGLVQAVVELARQVD